MIVPLLRTTEPACQRHVRKLLTRGESGSAQVEDTVRAILQEVRRKGDRALFAYTRQFDRVHLTPETLAITKAQMDAALIALPKTDLVALQAAARRIAVFHKKQRQQSWSYRDSLGVTLGQRIVPLERVGVYVPGGKAVYPSSVLMNVIPAKVAGVKEVVIVSPPSPQGDHPGILAAARLAGADRFFRVGGAQAVAALAYGTQTVPRVDKIVGPGNVYVATAKRLVFGQVDIDMVAGPSEVLVIADESASPAYVAADMLSQAEHDELAAALCLTDSEQVADAVVHALAAQLAALKRRVIATASLRRHGAVILARDRQEIVALANAIAPEHLELAVKNPRSWLKDIHHSGAIFLGHLSTGPFGDYVAGPNHVLPTGGTARFSSPLGVYDFLKRTNCIQASSRALAILGPQVVRLAEMEGLEAHARAVRYRLNGSNNRSQKRSETSMQPPITHPEGEA
ncbi:MAG TPA: histidinol dehydrogenase [Candidatus Binatia bacterium]|nr:histidinol dehydrogenase [Candidatus Binatia bacterium]